VISIHAREQRRYLGLITPVSVAELLGKHAFLDLYLA
jgi:hypothetical protein